MTRNVADCRDTPSISGCTLTISGEEETATLLMSLCHKQSVTSFRARYGAITERVRGMAESASGSAGQMARPRASSSAERGP